MASTNEASLTYLASRLERVGRGESLDAANLVRRVLATDSLLARLSGRQPAIDHPEAEHALFHTIWGHLSNAIDHGDFDDQHRDDVMAMENEMAGRVLTYRLAMGWLAPSAEAPAEFRTIEQFIEQHGAADLPRRHG